MDLKWLPFGLGRRQGSESAARRAARSLKSIGEKHGGKVIAGAAVISAIAAAVSGTGAFLLERTVRLRRRPLAPRQQHAAAALAGESGAVLASVQIEAEDATELRAWHFQLRKPAARTVLLLHGQGENRFTMIPYARMLLRHGFNVLCPDHRGHGESGGDVSSYGFREAQDVKRWVDWLKTEQQQEAIYAIGRSMGAAILLQALRLKPDLVAVVVEAPFSSMREMAFDRVGRPLRAGSWLGRTLLRPVVESGFAYGRMRYGIDLGEAMPEKALAECGIRVLLIHGDKDEVVPMRHATRLMECSEGTVQYWPVRGGSHCRALFRSPEEYEARVCALFTPPAVTA